MYGVPAGQWRHHCVLCAILPLGVSPMRIALGLVDRFMLNRARQAGTQIIYAACFETVSFS